MFAIFSLTLNAQNCEGPFNNTFIFQANNIGAGYHPMGNKFFNGDYGIFHAPYTSSKSPSTIFASAPWVGGYVNGELRIAAQTYGIRTSHDFYSGPLNNSAEILPDICHNFDRVWEVSRGEIINHIEDYNDNNIIDEPLPSVFGWPAQGNSFFAAFNGFALPDNHNGGWAEFEDLNQNSIYEPDLGEYPIIKLKDKKYIPNQIMWMVFNDQGEHKQTGGTPLGVELQLTVYGFLCTEDNTLNNSVFNSYKIINQGTATIDSLFLGSWTDYDLGCPADDFFGVDSTRNTEFVYNQDSLDGDPGMDCASSTITYGEHPPVQSMTYLSHPMNSLVGTFRSFDGSPGSIYNILNGLWGDGTPITAFETGYNPGENYPVTKFTFHGDPTDSTSWAQINFTDFSYDVHGISSVYLDKLNAGEFATVDMVYQYHQDLSLDHLQKINTMHANVDFLLNHLDSITLGCSFFPVCETDDCVWPGDFNHDGIADHFDLLYWGVMKDSSGSQRDGRINWQGHFADNWSLNLPNNLNAKHGDGNGNGITNLEDLERNLSHFLFTNYLYTPEFNYPEGPEIVIEASSINENGDIPFFQIKTGTEIENVLGLAYVIEFDSSLFTFSNLRIHWPSGLNSLRYSLQDYVSGIFLVNNDNFYSAVQTNHDTIKLPADYLLQRSIGGFKLKEGLSVDDIPDSTTFRLRNLIAIDAEGNDLGIGANTLVVYKDEISGISDLDNNEVFVYPNPADNTIYIDSPVATKAELLSADGRIVKILSLNQATEVDISDLQAGVYFMKFASSGKAVKIAIQ